MSIERELLPFAKPKDIEGKVTLSPAQRRALKDKLYAQQNGFCCTCGRPMVKLAGYPNTATLGHRNPEPMGAAKRDNDDNILGCQCWSCNTQRGSKRG